MSKTEFKIGDILEGTVSGIQNYGVFVDLSDQTQGLIHISELRHGYVNDVYSIVEVGQKVKVQIIDIDGFSGKISLSLRTLHKLNTPPYPYRPRRRKRRKTPNIGFETLANKMPKWIEEGLNLIEEDKFGIYSQERKSVK